MRLTTPLSIIKSKIATKSERIYPICLRLMHTKQLIKVLVIGPSIYTPTVAIFSFKHWYIRCSVTKDDNSENIKMIYSMWGRDAMQNILIKLLWLLQLTKSFELEEGRLFLIFMMGNNRSATFGVHERRLQKTVTLL